MNATPHSQPGRRRADGQLVAEILTVLQCADAPLTPGDVAERLDDSPTYSTVVTILSRLHAKRQLTRVRRGRAYAYSPVTDEAGFAARRMCGLLDERPDRAAVLSRFVDGLSSTDENLLRHLLGADTDRGR